ncbi:glycosyltransferase family 4 protein [Propionibacteriaceae bacterium Y1685]
MSTSTTGSSTTLVITNDFPPRLGGIENFVAQVCEMLDDDVIVLTSDEPGAASHDAGLPYEVIRLGRVLLPTKRVGEIVTKLIIERGITRVLFGAAAPLGLLAPATRRAGAVHVLALSHGHEVWWSKVPASRQLLRRIAGSVDVLGHISDFTGDQLRRVLREDDHGKLIRVPPPVDLDRFTPCDEHDPGLVVAAGRFVPRKGFDVLLEVWPRVVQDLAALPVAPRLEIVGDGPERRRLERAARGLPSVRIRPGVDHAEMPALLCRAAVFAMPVRTRLGGLDPEGLGMVAAEAAACGVPVLVGRSGGAPETVDDGRSGWVIDAGDRDLWRLRLVQLLSDPSRATAMGRAGRGLVTRRFGAHLVDRAVREALGIACPEGPADDR